MSKHKTGAEKRRRKKAAERRAYRARKKARDNQPAEGSATTQETTK